MGLHDRRVVIGVASGVVLLLALLVLTFCVASRRHTGGAPGEPVQHGMLQVEVGKPDAKLDTAKPLRCFVNGQFVGEKSLADCAKQNGVAAQALDVGLDQTGQVAAAQTGQTSLTPLPQVSPTPSTPAVPTAPAPPTTGVVNSAVPVTVPATGSGPTGQCLRFAGGVWRDAGASVGLMACVHTLYDGRCARPGDGFYGRFGAQTLRLVPGRVEISNDNRSFRTLVEQASDCSLP